MARATKVLNNRKGRAKAKSGICHGRGKANRRGIAPPRHGSVLRLGQRRGVIGILVKEGPTAGIRQRGKAGQLGLKNSMPL